MSMLQIVQVSLAIAVISSFVMIVQSPNAAPVADPWFLPVIVVLLWQSVKKT